jgi:hypothetical protein
MGRNDKVTGTEADEHVWKAVESGEFLIDDHGHVWRTRTHRGTPLRPMRRAEHKTSFGYLQVRKMVDGVRRGALAHRLVYRHFYGRVVPAGMTINHKNGVKDDNRPGNLEIVTYGENASHAHRTGLKTQRAERNPNGRLTDADVVSIRERRATGESLNSIARSFGIAFQTVSAIAKGKKRPDAGGPITRADGRKKAAGRILDGRTWDEMPGRAS